jgi:hypothetical protein
VDEGTAESVGNEVRGGSEDRISQSPRESYQEIQMEVVRLQRQKLLMEVKELKEKKSGKEEAEKSGLEKTFLNVFENVSDQTVNLDEYRGTGDVSVATWIQRVRSVAGLKGWSEIQIFKRALLSLKSPARDAVQNERKTEKNQEGLIFDMDSLEKFLHKRYGVRNPVSYYLDRFQKIR